MGKRKNDTNRDQKGGKSPKLSFRPQRSSVIRQDLDREAKKLAEEARKKEEKQQKEEDKARRAIEREAKRKLKAIETAANALKKLERDEKRAKKEEIKQKKERSISKQAKILSNFVVKLEKSYNEVQTFEVKEEQPQVSEDDDMDSDATYFEPGDSSSDEEEEPDIEILMENVVKHIYPDAPKFTPKPFHLKAGMKMAPIHRRRALNKEERKELEAAMRKGAVAKSGIFVSNVVKELSSRNKSSEEGRKPVKERLKVFKFRDHDLKKMLSFPKVWPRQEEVVRALRRCPWRPVTQMDICNESVEEIWDSSADEGSDEDERNFKGTIEILVDQKVQKPENVSEDYPITRSGLARSPKDVEDIDTVSEDSDSDANESDSDEESADTAESDQESELTSINQCRCWPESKLTIVDDDIDVPLGPSEQNSDSDSDQDSEFIIVDDDINMGPSELNSAAGDSFTSWCEDDDGYPHSENEGSDTFTAKMKNVRRDWQNLDSQTKALLPENLKKFLDMMFCSFNWS